MRKKTKVRINPFWGGTMQNCIALKNGQCHYSFHNILSILRHPFFDNFMPPQKGLGIEKCVFWGGAIPTYHYARCHPFNFFFEVFPKKNDFYYDYFSFKLNLFVLHYWLFSTTTSFVQMTLT